MPFSGFIFHYYELQFVTCVSMGVSGNVYWSGEFVICERCVCVCGMWGCIRGVFVVCILNTYLLAASCISAPAA